jgi:hypothetical protein
MDLYSLKLKITVGKKLFEMHNDHIHRHDYIKAFQTETKKFKDNNYKEINQSATKQLCNIFNSPNLICYPITFENICHYIICDNNNHEGIEFCNKILHKFD